MSKIAFNNYRFVIDFITALSSILTISMPLMYITRSHLF